MDDDLPIEATLDRRHEAARAAFAARDLDAYRDLFTGDCRYRQADGRVIDRAALMRDVAAQFRRLDRAETHFTREDLAVDGGEVTETLVQTATAEVSAFGLLRRIWQLRRHARYAWAIEDGVWKIARVDVLSEEVKGRWRLGRG